MNKVEYLKSIGYAQLSKDNLFFKRTKDNLYDKMIELKRERFGVEINTDGAFTSQDEIDELNKVFEEVQQDYNECMKHED